MSRHVHTPCRDDEANKENNFVFINQVMATVYLGVNWVSMNFYCVSPYFRPRVKSDFRTTGKYVVHIAKVLSLISRTFRFHWWNFFSCFMAHIVSWKKRMLAVYVWSPFVRNFCGNSLKFFNSPYAWMLCVCNCNKPDSRVVGGGGESRKTYSLEWKISLNGSSVFDV